MTAVSHERERRREGCCLKGRVVPVIPGLRKVEESSSSPFPQASCLCTQIYHMKIAPHSLLLVSSGSQQYGGEVEAAYIFMQALQAVGLRREGSGGVGAGSLVL